jgi:hypothetical protein
MGYDENQKSTKPETTSNISSDENACTITTPCPQQGWHAEEKEHRRKERAFWRAYIALTIFVVGGAVASALFAYGAYSASKRQASAAETQVGVAKDTEQRQLRAYLYVDHDMINAREKTATVNINIRHAGATPAYKIRLDTYMVTGRYMVGEIQMPDVTSTSVGGVRHSNYSILFGDRPQIGEEASFIGPSEEAMRAVWSKDPLIGDNRIYVYGVLRYFDVFGLDDPKLERRHEFCFVFHPERDPHGSERGCEKYNKPG